MRGSTFPNFLIHLAPVNNRLQFSNFNTYKTRRAYANEIYK